MAMMNDLYYEFPDCERPDLEVGKTVVLNVRPVMSVGDTAEIEVDIVSRRDFPNSTDFFGVATYGGVRYQAQVTINRNLAAGDGVVLTPVLKD